mgnify:CR=1 FL=1
MKNTYDMFRSTNPKLRKEAAEFLESLRDPFHFGKDPKVNNYNEIKELKQQLASQITKIKDIEKNGLQSSPLTAP